MEKKFSQGEWSIEENDTYNGIRFIWCESELSHIPKLVARTCFAPDSIANAKLIAAAPELLYRLNSLVLSVKAHPDYQFGEEGDEWHDIVSLAEETIKKATE